MLSTHKLEIFARVVEEGSFSRAAERLLMTQSGVSQHVRDLERSVGARLFRRGRRGVELTAAGQTLYGYVVRIFSLMAEAENAVVDVRQLAAGQVTIGATPGVSIYLLAEEVHTFRLRYPNLTVGLETKITSEIVEDVLAQRLDGGFIEGELDAPAPGLGVRELQVIDQYVVIGRSHRFWGRVQLSLCELDGETFIMRQPRSQSRIWLDATLSRQGVRPRIGAEFDAVESIKRAVAGGGALTILPEYAVRDELAYGVLQAIRLEGSPLQRTLKFIWDDRRHLTPICRALLAHLVAGFPALAGIGAPARPG